MSRYKKINDEKLEKLHQVQQEILDKIASVCKKYGLSYQLSGGTLLGAVRHKGFIPWDDDIDLTMVREDYDKFVEVAQKEFKDEFFLQCYATDDCYFPFIKVRKNNTLFDEQEIAHLDCHKGIFVDIFPFERINNPDSIILKLKAILIKNIWDCIFVKRSIYKSYKETRHPILCRILGVFSYKFLRKKQIKMMKSVNVKDGKYLCALVGGYDYKKDIHEYSQMFPTEMISFEGKLYESYKNPDYYLKHLYGDYMALPPENKRINHAPERIIFDTTKEKNLH